MSYRLSVTSTILSIATLFGVSNASAQQCANGNCRLQSQPAPLAGLFSVFGYRGHDQFNNSRAPRYTGYGVQNLQEPSAAARAGGQCGLNGVCENCNCTGNNCTCGPNCSTHNQSQQRFQTQPQRPLVQPTRGYRDNVIQAPRPATNPYRPASYSTSIQWETDFRAAVERSRATGQPMLVQVTAEWCGYCQQMKRETFTDRNLISDVNRSFVSVKLDADANRELVQQMNVKSLPTTLVILPNMQVAERLEGFQSAAQMFRGLSRHMQRAELETGAHVAVR